MIFLTGWSHSSYLLVVWQLLEIEIFQILCLCVSRVISEDEFDEGRKGGLSDEEFEPYSEKRWVQIEKMGLLW